MYRRKEYTLLKQRLEEPRHFIQVLMGPRQIGKSTLVKQVIKDLPIPHLLFAADDVPTSQKKWISDCWAQARLMLRAQRLKEMVLVIDEIQKLTGWSETVKKEWDADTYNDVPIK